MEFKNKRPISEVAMNILRKRYFLPGETAWDEVVNRVIKHVLRTGFDTDGREIIREMMLNRWFIPNSPCLVNSGKENGGLLACFVVPFEDTIEDIYHTKMAFALIAKKGGGCGTTLSNIRPRNAKVNGSAHGYAGGPIDFYDTICHDMEVITQAGFRNMAQMGVMSVYHPDIINFITVKEVEGKMSTTNLSVGVDSNFMKMVEKDEEYATYFDFEDGRKYYETYRARDIFNLIVEGAWRNGEPGIVFLDKINESPYQHAGIKIEATNPCGEQPLPPYGSCNLGSLDLSKFYDENTKNVDYEKLEIATRWGIRFLDKVIDLNVFPMREIEDVAKKSRAVGLGIMGLADYFLMKKIAYGSQESLVEIESIMEFIYKIAEDESIKMGKELGIPKWCKNLPVPRRNITLLSIAPTGTISLIAGCTSGIEPVFSEITIRNDKTGTYQFDHDLSSKPFFRCAVSANGAMEVAWNEHVWVQASVQKHVDTGVSKTINFPQNTHRETMAKAFIEGWHLGCKGMTVYRNSSRKVEVLSPKSLKKDRCPSCDAEILKFDGCKKCTKCDWTLCDI